MNRVPWEECEIEWVTLTRPDRLGRRLCRLVAQTQHPEGRAVVDLSPPFWVSRADGPGDDPATGSLAVAVHALHHQLISDGWEEVPGGPGANWNRRRFRRQVSTGAIRA